MLQGGKGLASISNRKAGDTSDAAGYLENFTLYDTLLELSDFSKACLAIQRLNTFNILGAGRFHHKNGVQVTR